ncbi:hypothetical protein [Mariniplasma anaerobium]|uniref:Uncharacterized protein n=1 Tax=Mariniplasma anaerobium TaxID=2735436 RepID=A0A7U9TJV3_9MOLU|nr:hypothetical protein [Mariniplasma anaerobium]BCR36686.1 hypothetical protein MPAN_015790 [Mariniplasma anaerobium]
MNDERIASELNKIKGYILVLVFITTLLFSGTKFLVYGFIYQLYLVDIFVLLVSGIVISTTFVMKHSNQYDERLEQSVGRIYKLGYAVLLIGGFWIHYFAVSITPFDMIAFGYITNTLILIGFVVLIVLLKRKKLYANYKMIEEDSSAYYKLVLQNIGKLLIMFILILGSILLVDYLFMILVIDIQILALLIGVSFVMLSIEYVIFAAYEKNHYDETRLTEKNAPRYLTKNAVLFFGIIAIFQIASSYVNMRYNLLVGNFQTAQSLYLWSFFKALIEYLSIDFAIIRLILMLIIYTYVKSLTGHKIVMKMVLANAILSFTVSIAGAFTNILLPIITRNMDSGEEIQSLASSISYINLGFSVVFIGFVAFVAFNLYKYRIIYYKFTFIYVAMLIIFHPFIISTIWKESLKEVYIAQFVVFVIKTITLWILYYVYSNKQFNLELGLEKHVTYDHKIK